MCFISGPNMFCFVSYYFTCGLLTRSHIAPIVLFMTIRFDLSTWTIVEIIHYLFYYRMVQDYFFIYSNPLSYTKLLRYYNRYFVVCLFFPSAFSLVSFNFLSIFVLSQLIIQFSQLLCLSIASFFAFTAASCKVFICIIMFTRDVK